MTIDAQRLAHIWTLRLRPCQKFVLLAVEESEGDDLTALSKMTGYSERRVRTILSDLRNMDTLLIRFHHNLVEPRTEP